MALTYRTPVEEILGAYNTVEQSLIASTSISHLKNVESKDHEFFNLALSARAKERLCTAGIYLSPYSCMPHSHPACKTLENQMLYRVLPNYIDNSFFFVGIKESKVNFLKKRNPSSCMIKTLNRFVTAKDAFRYPNEFVAYQTTCSRNAFAGSSSCKSATLTGLLPQVIAHKARNLFLHDELHYWSKDDLFEFLQRVKPNKIVGTLVYPPELIAGSRESLNKWCYEYEIVGGDLLFFPDGVRSEGYCQPVHGGYLLKAGQLVLPNGDVYCVTLEKSYFAHHLISIVKGDFMVDKYRSFSNFEAITTSALSAASPNIQTCYPIARDTVMKVYMYMVTLLRPDGQSAMAKLSQIVGQPTGPETRFIQEFSAFVISTKQSSTMLYPDLKTRMNVFLAKLIPKFAQRLMHLYKDLCLQDFIHTLVPYTFREKVVSIDSSWTCELEFHDFPEEFLNEEAIIANLDSTFEFGAVSMLVDRQACEYFVLGSGEKAFYFSLECPEQLLLNLALKYLGSSHDLGEWRRYSMAGLRRVLHTFLSCSSLGRLLLHNFRFELIRKIMKQYSANLAYKRKFFMSAFTVEELFRWSGKEQGYRGYRKFLCYTGNFATTDHIRKLSKVLREIDSRPTSGGGMPGKTWVQEELSEAESDESSEAPPAVNINGKALLTQKSLVESDSDVDVNEPAAFSCECQCGTALKGGLIKGLDLADPVFVDSLKGRKGSWYSIDGTDYSYNGGSHRSQGWPEWISFILVENDFKLSEFNCMLAQKYEENGSIGFHADDEQIFDPLGRVLTFTVQGSCLFHIKCKKGGDSVKFHSGRWLMMPKGFQSTHKHSVTACKDSRISLTFRSLKRVGPYIPSAPITESKQGMYAYPELSDSDADIEKFDFEIFNVRVCCAKMYNLDGFKRREVLPDGNCFWHACGSHLGLNGLALKEACRGLLNAEQLASTKLMHQFERNIYAEDEAICAFASIQKVKVHVHNVELGVIFTFEPAAFDLEINLVLEDEHFSPLFYVNDCVVKAIASSLKRDQVDVLRVLYREENARIYNELIEGGGLCPLLLGEIFLIFGINAIVEWGQTVEEFNPQCQVRRVFSIADDHIEHVERLSTTVHPDVVPGEVEGFPKSSLKILTSAGTQLTYHVSYARAEILSQSLLDGTTGAICSKLFNSCEPLLCNIGRRDFERNVYAIIGTAGSGKSTIFKNFFLKSPGKCVTFVSPRKALAESVKEEIYKNCSKSRDGKQRSAESKNWSVLTFEVFLKVARKTKAGQVLILDEIQLYPPGYLDLVLLNVSESVHVFAVGDPCQSSYDSEKDRAIFESSESDICRLLGKNSYKFVVRSRRFKNDNFINRIPVDIQPNQCTISEEYYMLSEFQEVNALPEQYKKVFLVPSFEEKRIITSRFKSKDVKCLTFGESTGMTFKYGVILITTSAALVCEKRWFTCVTRFSHNFAFMNCTGLSYELLSEQYQGRFLKKFLTGSASVDDLLDMLPGEPEPHHEFIAKIGKDHGVREEKLAGDPWLKTMIFLGQQMDMQEPVEGELPPCEVRNKTHLMVEETENIRAGFVHKFKSKEERECRLKNVVTDQFAHEHSKANGVKMTNAAERFAAIYPRHKSTDKATFIMAVKKRLKFSRPCVELAKLREARPFGESMLQLFLRYVPLKPAHDKEMMQSAVRDFEDKKTSKSGATIANHSQRSSDDWKVDYGHIFMKSQMCTKFEKRFCDAKAAQSIVCFQHRALVRFAPYMRYLEKKVAQVLPRNFYIHSGKGLNELDEWVKSYRFDGLCTESDYEAFDASQDQYIMSFEISLMEYMGLPRDLINDYIFIKTHLTSKLGDLAIMRFSGEASTFLFNTLANMLFTFMRYDVTGKEAICFAGDDMCAFPRLRHSEEHAHFLSKLKLKAKVEHTRSPTFCGWNLTPYGIYKKPQLVLDRLMIALEEKNLRNCIDNYALEVAFAFQKGELIVCSMDPEEAKSHSKCVRLLIRNKHLMKSEVRFLFEGLR